MYIASDNRLAYDARVKRLARALGVERPAAIGHLHLLWWWCQTYAKRGNVSPEEHRASELANAALWHGDPERFIGALVRCGFIEERGAELWLADWERIGMKAMKEQAGTRRRVAAYRERQRQTSTGEEALPA